VEPVGTSLLGRGWGRLKTMSQKGKARRAAREAQQEKEGKKVINWIFGALILLGIIYVVYAVATA